MTSWERVRVRPRLKARLRRLAGRLIIGAFAAVARPPRPTAPPEYPHRILVIRLDLLGDLMLSVPAIRAVRRRWPRAELTALVLPYTAPLLGHFPEVDRVITFDPNRLRPSGTPWLPAVWADLLGVVRRLRASRFDLALALYGPWAGLLAYLSGARFRVGYGAESHPKFFHLSLPGRRYLVRRHEAEYTLAVAAAVGAPPGPQDYSLEPQPEASARVETKLAQLGVPAGMPLIGVQVGAANGWAKQWYPDKWAAAAGEIARRWGAAVVFTGTARERPLAEAVRTRLGGPAWNLAGETDIPELVALLGRLSLFLSGDTGPMHLATALGVPTVALHGPTDPALSGPWPPGRGVVVRLDLPCSPCYDLTDVAICPLGHHNCLRLLGPEAVVAAAEALRVLR